VSIHFDAKARTLTLNTAHTTYQMQIAEPGHLLHLYYGSRAEGCLDYLYLPHDCGFSPNPYERHTERGWSLDTLPQEYSGSNGGDYRLPSLALSTDSGVVGAELRYVSHTIEEGKYALSSLPTAWDRGGEAQTLTVTLRDEAAGLTVELLYGVYEEQDVITRAVRLINSGSQTIRLERAASACLDLPFGRWDMLHFHGRHTLERQSERRELMVGTQGIGSRRGTSSHQHNPFLILCEHDATEDHGDCCGAMLVYSGSFAMEVERDQMDSVRLVAGIADEGFSWQLLPGALFETPELLLSFTDSGLTALSQRFQRFLRRNICRGPWAERPRPVLLNSWEAAYFDIDAERIRSIARGAADLGVDLLVMDDGWFGERCDDHRALGDWTVNPQKFPAGLGAVIDEIRDMGLSFGLWVEPEMVSEDSALYRAHPDWALRVPGRAPTLGRDQLVLDLSRAEVEDFVYETVASLLRAYPIAYIKWDMNRSLSDVASRALPPERQGETAHRYLLGLYRVMDRLTREFPEVLFEGCSGGGGRFDAGILAYFPQIWCSDNTDPIARLSIQEGTSFAYPYSAIAAHVSASPNHQTGRQTPLGTRGFVAATGAFGYELDPGRLTETERDEIRAQIAAWREREPLLRAGEHYRLSAPEEPYCAWQFVAADQSETLFTLVMRRVESNPRPLHLRLKGLDAEACYEIVQQETAGCALAVPDMSGTVLPGSALLRGGVTLPPLYGDYPGIRLLLRKQ